MRSSPPLSPAEPPLGRLVLDAARYYLGSRRGLIVVAIAVVGLGLALNWSWLAAAGIAPLLLAVLPCAAMCALGLCMSRMGGACSSGQSTSDTTASTTPVVAVEPNLLTSGPRAANPTVGLSATSADVADPTPATKAT